MADVRGDVGTLLGLGGSEPWGNTQVMTQKISSAFSTKFGRNPSIAELNGLMAGDIVTLKNVSTSAPTASVQPAYTGSANGPQPVAKPTASVQPAYTGSANGPQPAGQPAAKPVAPSVGVSGFAGQPAAKPVANPSGASAYQQAMQQQQVAPSVGGQQAGKPVALPDRLDRRPAPTGTPRPAEGAGGTSPNNTTPAKPVGGSFSVSPVQELVGRLNRGESLSSEELGRVLAYGQSLQNPKQREDEKNALASFGNTGVPDVDAQKIKTDLAGSNTGLGTNVGGSGSGLPPKPIQPPKAGTYQASPPSGTPNPNWRANYTPATGPQTTGATRVAGPTSSTWDPNQGLPAFSSSPAAQGAPVGHPGAPQQAGPAGQYQPRNFAPVVPQNQNMSPAQQYQLTQLQQQQGKAYAAPDYSQYQAKPGSYNPVTIKQSSNPAQQYQLAQLQSQQSQPVSIARGQQYDPTKADAQWSTQTNQNMQGVPLATAPKTNWAAPSSYYNAAMGGTPTRTTQVRPTAPVQPAYTGSANGPQPAGQPAAKPVAPSVGVSGFAGQPAARPVANPSVGVSGFAGQPAAKPVANPSGASAYQQAMQQQQLTPAQAYQQAMQQRTMIQGNPPPMNTAYLRGM